VINYNLQRLDGPVRCNGKIIQEIEGLFHGAGWNVIKLVWGGRWDPLLARDTTSRLRQSFEAVLPEQTSVAIAAAMRLDGEVVRSVA
jgi:pyruvate dehydrogenase E1 component